jgi:xanthine phosphoribosyltransferase
MEHKLIFPTYEEMHDKAVKLAHLLKEKKVNFNKMVVVSRGGFVPASVVAYTLGIQDVDIVSIQSYIHRQVDKAIVHRAPKTDEVVLVIDDIVDQGGTAKALKEYMPNMHLAVIYAKPRGLPLAGTYVEAITQDTWPVFPWDEEDKNNH